MQISAKSKLADSVGSITLDLSWAEFNSQCRGVCDHFLTLAAASLLADFKPDFFFQNSLRSAENWRRFLLCAQSHYQERPSLMYCEPLYAAINANDLTLVQKIKEALPTTWSETVEYQHRFLIPDIFSDVALSDFQTVSVELNTKLEQLYECEPEPIRAKLFSALLGLDDLTEDDFWDQFETALYAHEEQIQNKISAVSTKISEFIAHRFIWFEGLAWLRLAQHKRFSRPSEHMLFCPDEALKPNAQTYSGDWPLVPLPNGTY